MMTYSLSPVHTDEYYVERARELVKLKADFISIKDPTGLLTPERGRTLFPGSRAGGGRIPMQLHSHCQSALAPEVYEIAMKVASASDIRRPSRWRTAPRCRRPKTCLRAPGGWVSTPR